VEMALSLSANAGIVAVAAIILYVYLVTVSVSIAGGDSGEIVAEGCHLGTAHPPGYPLLTMIIHMISTWTSFGDTVAFRINCFCVGCTTVASIFIGKLVQMLSPAKAPTNIDGAALAMGMFAFSPLIWQYATTSEVFPFNTMMASLILYLVVLFSRYGNVATAYLGALLCGLAFCNQHTIVLFEVPLILWMLFLLRTHIARHPSCFLWLSSSFLLGVTPYAYLPLAALYAPQPGSWGHVTTLAGFLHHVLRKDYGTFQLFSGAEGKTAEGFWARNEAFLVDFFSVQVGGTGSLAMRAEEGEVLDDAAASAVGGDGHRAMMSFLFVGLLLLGVAASIVLPSLHLLAPPRGTSHSNSAKAAAAAAKKSVNVKAVAAESFSSSSSASVVGVVCAQEASFTPLVLVLTQIFYFAVFHSLSNLPLKDRLLYGVHQRFWMQPNVLMFTWIGVGFNVLLHLLASVAPFATSALTTSPANDTSSPNKGGKNVSTKQHSGGDADKSNNSTTSSSSSGSSSVSAGRWATGAIHQLLGLSLVALLVYRQCVTWLPAMDMSRNNHFRSYASAVLNPLPPGAVLLINYDQQWTSVRYLQVSEAATWVHCVIVRYWFVCFFLVSAQLKGFFHGCVFTVFLHCFPPLFCVALSCPAASSARHAKGCVRTSPLCSSR
jgi:hypothetical protein